MPSPKRKRGLDSPKAHSQFFAPKVAMWLLDWLNKTGEEVASIGEPALMPVDIHSIGSSNGDVVEDG